jgi:hypothetical protein
MNGWSWTAGAGAVEPMRISWGLLPPDIEEMGARSGGDITGAKGSQATRARAVGDGQDQTVARAQAIADYASSRKFKRFTKDQVVQVDKDKLVARAIEIAPAGADVASITTEEWQELCAIEAEIKALESDTTHKELLAAIAADHDIGHKILTLAGGRGFGRGYYPTLEGSGVAASAARYLKRKRQCIPSDTSIHDAAGAAALAIWHGWSAHSAVCELWSESTQRYLARLGWRAAHNSLCHDAIEGKTGEKADRRAGFSVPIEHALEHVDKASLDEWARDRQGRTFNAGGDVLTMRAARREVLNWIARVLDLNAPRRVGIAERKRFSVLVRLIHGRDFASASRAAGFETGRGAVESFRTGKVWARLRRACSLVMSARERMLYELRKRFATEARLAINCQRAARAGAGASELLPAIACEPVTVPAGTSRAVREHGRTLIKRPVGSRKLAVKGVRGRGRVHPQARAWRDAVEWRAQAIATAHHARKLLIAARAARARAFDSASRGWRSGWLR